MITRSTLGALMALGLMSASANTWSGTNDGSLGHGVPDKVKKVIPKGCKEYTMRGETVVATSEKRAWKKIDKILKKKYANR
jgi:hypothetical protein